MNQTFYLFHDTDCYEISLQGHIISRITRYANGSQMRQEMDYDLLPIQVQDGILTRVEKILCQNDNS